MKLIEQTHILQELVFFILKNTFDHVIRTHIQVCVELRALVAIYASRMSQMESGKRVSIGIRLIMVPHRACMNS